MTYPVVSDADQFRTAFRYQFQFYLRTYRFIGVLVFVLIISLDVLGVQIFLDAGGVGAGQYLSTFLGNLAVLVILGAALLGACCATRQSC